DANDRATYHWYALVLVAHVNSHVDGDAVTDIHRRQVGVSFLIECFQQQIRHDRSPKTGKNNVPAGTSSIIPGNLVKLYSRVKISGSARRADFKLYHVGDSLAIPIFCLRALEGHGRP